MILPEHIKVGFEIYSVAVGNTMDAGDEGECNREKGSILVKSGMSDRRTAETIVHEVLHACWDQAGLPYDEKPLGALLEEDVILRLAPLLTAAILDSPQLRQMLERVAGAANGTCWKWQERSVELPRMGAKTASQMAEYMGQSENKPMLQRGSDPRSDQLSPQDAAHVEHFDDACLGYPRT
jgi:hypothetical protein